MCDHHKGWMLAKITRESMACESIVQYVHHKLNKQEQTQLSVAHCIKFGFVNVENANYASLDTAHIELLGALFAYRAGLRSGH